MLVMNLAKIKALQGGTNAGKKGKKGKKAKKSKKGKKGKGKKEKPLPGAKIAELKNLDSDYMLSLLVENGIINNPRKHVTIGDFLGTDEISSRTYTSSAYPDTKMVSTTNTIIYIHQSSQALATILPRQ